MVRGPNLGDSTSVMVKVPAEMAAALDDLRRSADDLPSRPEIIRRLLAAQLGLEWRKEKG